MRSLTPHWRHAAFEPASSTPSSPHPSRIRAPPILNTDSLRLWQKAVVHQDTNTAATRTVCSPPQLAWLTRGHQKMSTLWSVYCSLEFLLPIRESTPEPDIRRVRPASFGVHAEVGDKTHKLSNALLTRTISRQKGHVLCLSISYLREKQKTTSSSIWAHGSSQNTKPK